MNEDRKQRDRGAPEPGSRSPRDEGFLSRWSRRKRDVAAPEQPAKVEARADQNVIAKTPARDTVEPANAKTDADMPPIESLDENSDYSPFLSPKVSQKLRSVALRKLFHMAGFNIRDGLDDYDDDFTVFEPLGDTVTADMRHQMEREEEKARQRLAERDEESVEELTEQSDDDREQTELASTDDDVAENESALDVPSDDDGDDGDDSPHAAKNKA
ncbi:MAG: DUF3306 domain-containing protein [Acidiferrobacterales bacterium]